MVDPSRDLLFSSLYGGYAGSSQSVLPPAVLLTSSFWDDRKIDSTVTAAYIRTKLSSDALRRKLDEPIDVSGSLTDSSFLQWIRERARKLFLILAELGCAEKIFDLIDGSTGAWEDADLPLSPRSLERMRLGAGLEKKFLKKQYLFLLRDLEPGTHVDYEDAEQVPLEVIFKPTARGQSSIEKVYYPRLRDVYYSRRRVPLPTADAHHAFLDEIAALRKMQHPHIVSLHASYTHQSAGFQLLSPTVDLTLKNFLHYPTQQYKNLPKDQRKQTLLTWLHCLASAVSYLTTHNLPPPLLTPSLITIDASTTQPLLTPTLPPPPAEAYDYSPPELWTRHLTAHSTTLSTTISGRTKLATPSQTTTHIATYTTPPPPSAAATIFSLAACALDILTLYAGRRLRAFVAHRTSRNRRPRESAPPDASFHANLPRVVEWIALLEADAAKKGDWKLGAALEVVKGMVEREVGARRGVEDVLKGFEGVVGGTGHCGEGEEADRRRRLTVSTCSSFGTQGSARSNRSEGGFFGFSFGRGED